MEECFESEFVRTLVVQAGLVMLGHKPAAVFGFTPRAWKGGTPGRSTCSRPGSSRCMRKRRPSGACGSPGSPRAERGACCSLGDRLW